MDRRLGRPLPHQLPNPTRADPLAINLSPVGLIRYHSQFPGAVPYQGARSHALLTRPPLEPKSSLDLHVLGLPPAFVLSQDQTLKLKRPEGRLLDDGPCTSRQDPSRRAPASCLSAQDGEAPPHHRSQLASRPSRADMQGSNVDDARANRMSLQDIQTVKHQKTKKMNHRHPTGRPAHPTSPQPEGHFKAPVSPSTKPSLPSQHSTKRQEGKFITRRTSCRIVQNRAIHARACIHEGRRRTASCPLRRRAAGNRVQRGGIGDESCRLQPCRVASCRWIQS